MACASSTRTASPSARPIRAALAISSGDPAWDALIAAYLDVLEKDPRSLACMDTWNAYRSEEAAMRATITFTPAPNHFALFQKLTVGQPFVDNLFNPEVPKNRRDVAARAKKPDAWNGAPLFFAMHDKAMRDPTSPRIATTPQKIAELASAALTPMGCAEPYDFFGDVEAQSEKAARATSFSPYAVSLFRACYLDACRLSGATPPPGMAYPDAAAEIAAECGMSQAEARWSLTVATWEAIKAGEEAKRALSDEEFAAQEGTTWDEYQAEPYWRAYEALQLATPPDAKGLAYQMRETLATTGFMYIWRGPDCRRSLSDLFNESGEAEVLVRTYQAVLRMAGETDHVALTARPTPAFIEPNDPGADVQAAWTRHHELFEAIEAAGVPDREQFGAFERARYHLRWSAAHVQALRNSIGRDLTRDDFEAVLSHREQAKVAA